MSIVLGIGDTQMLAEWWRQHRTTIGDPPPPDIGTGYYSPPPVAQGWQCPVCKTVWSPSQLTCPHSDEHAAAYLKIQLELDALRRMVKEATE